MKAAVVLSILTLVAPVIWVNSAWAESPKPKTVEAWDTYAAKTEAAIGTTLKANAEETAAMKSGSVYLRHIDTAGVAAPGIIHHWMAGILIPGAKIKPMQAWMQDYGSHSKYFWDVEQSKLLSRDGDTYKVFFRFRRKKIITVHYNTEHTVVYHLGDATHATSRSVATRIAEIEDPGSTKEREKPVGNDSGFLWRLNSYWRFVEAPEGLYLECESISLSRGIPTGLGWLIKGYVESVPRESLEATLTSIRKGFTGK